MNNSELVKEIKQQAFSINLNGTTYQVVNASQEGNLSFNYYKSLDKRVKNPLKEVHILALENGIIPARYLDNVFHYGIENQIKLLRSKVAICGVGTIGSEIAENLARLGVGEICLMDTGLLKEDSLNSQRTSLPEFIMISKSTLMKLRIHDINSAIQVYEYSEGLPPDDFREIVNGYDLVIQTNDSSMSNLESLLMSIETSIPFVIAALDGLNGLITTVLPAGLSGSKAELMKKAMIDLKQSKAQTLPHKASIFGGNVTEESIKHILEGNGDSTNRIVLI